MARYQSGAVVLHTTDLNSGNAINIGGVTQMDLDTGTETISDDSGAIYDEVRSVFSQVPDGAVSFKSIATILDYIGLAGYCIASDGSHPGLRLFGRVLSDCKSPPAATDNIRYTIAKGLIRLGSLSMPRGADAQITIGIDPITDGTNAPFSETYSGITLPTGLLTQQFTLGRCKIANVSMTDLGDLSLDFAVATSAKTPELGGVWPDSVAVREVKPVLMLNGFNPTVLQSGQIPLLGKQCTHANTIIQLKKREGYSAFVADATEQHIRITMSGIVTIRKVFSGSGNGEATNVVCIEGVHDGTNVPVLYDTTAAYLPSP